MSGQGDSGGASWQPPVMVWARADGAGPTAAAEEAGTQLATAGSATGRGGGGALGVDGRTVAGLDESGSGAGNDSVLVPGVIFMGEEGEPLRPLRSSRAGDAQGDAEAAGDAGPSRGGTDRLPGLAVRPGAGAARGAGDGGRSRRRLTVLAAAGALVVALVWALGAALGSADPSGPTDGALPEALAGTPDAAPPAAAQAGVPGHGAASDDGVDGAPADPADPDRSPDADGPSHDVAVPTGPLATVDWLAIMVGLDRQRTAALAAGEPATVTQYTQPGSPAEQADSRTIESLVAAGVRPVGLETRIVGVEVIQVHPAASARLRVVDERAGYQLVDGSGKVVNEIEPAGQRTWEVELAQLTGGGDWRVVRVEPA